MVKDDKKDAYQNCITAFLNRKHDDDASGDTDRLEDAPFGKVLTAIPKVSF